jgi:hypothetical protein
MNDNNLQNLAKLIRNNLDNYNLSDVEDLVKSAKSSEIDICLAVYNSLCHLERLEITVDSLNHQIALIGGEINDLLEIYDEPDDVDEPE